MDNLNFVVCPSYHGATLLSLLLNNHSRVTSLGDTIPGRKYLGAGCACGTAVRDCPFWSAVLGALDSERFTAGEKVLPLWPRIVDDRQRWNRIAAVGLGTLAHVIGPSAWALFRKEREEYTDTYSRFYAVVKDLHGTNLFVDGSKSMSKAFVLASMFPQAGVRIVHLVRDPRDYHCSNQKNNLDSATLVSSSRQWLDRHLAIISMARLIRRKTYLRVRYEDLCGQPEATLSAVFQLFGIDYEDVLHRPKDRRKNHVIGNDSMARFDGTIRASSNWRSTLSDAEARQVVRRTWPLCGYFGYV